MHVDRLKEGRLLVARPSGGFSVPGLAAAPAPETEVAEQLRPAAG